MTPPSPSPSTTTTADFYSVPSTFRSPDDARAAATSGTSLLLLDVPAGTVVGVDHRSFVVGPNFKGIKMIPPRGVHFVSTNATSSTATTKDDDDVKRKSSASPPPPRPPPASSSSSVGPTNFFFFHARPAHVVVRRWSAEHEVLVPLDDEDEERRFVAGVKSFDFDAGLAPYDLGSWPLWRSLTRFITEETVERVAPPKCSKGKKVVAMSVVAEAEEVEKRKRREEGRGGVTSPTEAERRLEEQLERGRKERERRERASASGAAAAAAAASSSPPQPVVVVPDVVGAPRYAQLPRHAVVSVGGSGGGGGGGGNDDNDGNNDNDNNDDDKDKSIKRGRLLTAANLDKTSTLISVVNSPDFPFRGDARELLGEFQHAFLSFWAGHSLLAFAAWRDAVRLVFSCDSGPCLPPSRNASSSSSDTSKKEEEIEEESRCGREIDGAWFRAFVDALSSQLEVATTTMSSTTTNSSSSSSFSSSSPLLAVDDLLRDSFLRKSARRFLEGVREAAEEGGVDVEVEEEEVVAVDDGGGSGGGGGQERATRSRSLPAPSPELLASCSRLSRVLEERLGWAGLGKPRLRELRIGDEGGGRGGRGGGGDGSDDDDDDDSDDDSDGPVVVVDLEKGY